MTKPLGSGALLAAWMRGQCRADWYEALIARMLLANARAGAICAEAGVRACTDVTGFGLAGHLLEMLDASHMSAHLLVKNVPVYAGFDDVVSQGMVSTLHRDNAKVSCRVQCSAPPPAWLFDPQTSGGLLAAVKPGSVARTLQQLKDSGYSDAAVIGDVLSIGPGEAPTIML